MTSIPNSSTSCIISFKCGGENQAWWCHLKISLRFLCCSEDNVKPLHLKEVTAECQNKQPYNTRTGLSIITAKARGRLNLDRELWEHLPDALEDVGRKELIFLVLHLGGDTLFWSLFPAAQCAVFFLPTGTWGLPYHHLWSCFFPPNKQNIWKSYKFSRLLKSKNWLKRFWKCSLQKCYRSFKNGVQCL